MIGMVAAVFAFAQYQAMLDFSLRDDPVRAQLVMKNRVLVTAVLILSYGIYVPKSWRRAALVVGPLAISAVRDLAGALSSTSRGDGMAGRIGLGAWHDAVCALRLRCDDPADPGRRIRLRGPHDLAAAAAGHGGPATRPVSPAAATRRRRDGRSLPGRAPASETPLRREADPAGHRIRPEGPGAVRARGPAHRDAFPPEHRRDLRLRPDRGRHLLLCHGIPAGA